MAVVYLLLRHFRTAEMGWQVERRELLSRIQRPDQIPVTPRPDFVFEPDERDEVDLIGTIADPKDES